MPADDDDTLLPFGSDVPHPPHRCLLAGAHGARCHSQARTPIVSLASGEFSTLRLRLLKIAVLVRETASRIRLGFAAHGPNAALFRDLIGASMPRTG